MVNRKRGCLLVNGEYDWEMITHICFDCNTFKIIIKDGIGDNIVYCCICITSYSFWFICCWYDAKFKHKINKILDFFIVFIIEDIDIKITWKEKCFVSCPILRKNFVKKVSVILRSLSGGSVYYINNNVFRMIINHLI